jgi:hypothetical protein
MALVSVAQTPALTDAEELDVGLAFGFVEPGALEPEHPVATIAAAAPAR